VVHATEDVQTEEYCVPEASRSEQSDDWRRPDLLNKISLFRGESTENVSALGALLHQQCFVGGSVIMSTEQVGEVVYLIIEGTVKIHRAQADGSDVLIAILGPGDIVGEMSLIDDMRRCATVVTLEDSTMLWMDRSSFRRCLRTMPVLSYNLTCILAARLRLADSHIESLATRDVESRVARQLVAFAARYGRPTPDGGVLIPIRLTQTEIASMVGASRESVNKIMVSYKERKFISVDLDQRITVHNKQALAKQSR
jgi:CRP/FNR family transcriptional regulator, cyclic AMP receptor protein